MADALISAVFEQLRSMLQLEAELVSGVKTEVKNLTKALNVIKGVLADAEEKQLENDALKEWLEQLKNIFYDLEDVLDEWNTRAAISVSSQLDVNPQLGKKIKSYLLSLLCCFQPIVLRHGSGKKIKELKEELYELLKMKDSFNLMEGKKEEHRQITISMVDVSELYGRIADKETIVGKLLRDGMHCLSHVPLISIVGTGGFGKTTLARLILKQDQVMTNFEKIIWVCVSNPFDIIRVAKEIIEQANGRTSDDFGREALFQTLSTSVQGKRFLLVLDDVWSYEEENWTQLKLSLNNGATGSRIIITTRDEQIVRKMGSTYTHRLGQLSDEDSWLLFRHIAFLGREKDLEDFKDIGKGISEKCKGVPLAVKTIASLMRLEKRKQDWHDLLGSDIWQAKEVQKGILPSLFLSYYALPPELKPCFIYCAIFEKDAKIEKNRLVKLWMAQGFLHADGNMDLEKIGGKYFDNLAMRSFFQDFAEHGEGNVRCKMHDLIRDFAQFISKNSILLSDGEKSEKELHFLKVRHLSTRGQKSSAMYNQKSLRTLSAQWPHGTMAPRLFHRLTCLRVLDLRKSDIEELPTEVGTLFLLRYLDLSSTPLKVVPSTLYNLFHLQTLQLDNCKSLTMLPAGIGKLTNLRHLAIGWGTVLHSYPVGIGNLSCLRTVNPLFFTCDAESTVGWNIGELKLLNRLQGKLQITELGRVEDVNDILRVELRKKENLTSWELHFNGGFQEDKKKSEDVMEALQPHPNIEKLTVFGGYPGHRLPMWVLSLPNLVELKLESCTGCSQLPAFGKLPSLREFTLHGIQKVEHIGCEFYGLDTFTGVPAVHAVIFPKLERLGFIWMEGWKKWELPFQDTVEFFPNLLSVKIDGCQKLQVLPGLGKLKVLESLELRGMPMSCMGPEFWGTQDDRSTALVRDSKLTPVAEFPALATLTLWYMNPGEMQMTAMHQGILTTTTTMPCLKMLELNQFQGNVLPGAIFFDSLKELVIEDCPELIGMQPCLPPLLEKLTLSGNIGVLSTSLLFGRCLDMNYSNLKTFTLAFSQSSSLPQCFNKFTSIQTLVFTKCTFLDFTPEDLKHLTKLVELKVERCPLLYERYKDGGQNRGAISHIAAARVTKNYDLSELREEIRTWL